MSSKFTNPVARGEWVRVTSVDAALEVLTKIYDASAQNLRMAFDRYLADGTAPTTQERAQGVFAYPRMRVTYKPAKVTPPSARSYGKFDTAGTYEADFTRPALYANYLKRQLQLLLDYEGCQIDIGLSREEIPYPFIIESGKGLDAEEVPPAELATVFPVPDLTRIDDDVPNGDLMQDAPLGLDSSSSIIRPLSLFSALRTDYSLARLRHYTGTAPDDVQQFILFTNYQRYMEEFAELGMKKLEQGGDYEELVAPGGVRVRDNSTESQKKIATAPWHKSQMPAYHLTAKDGMGITLVNIGVGPSNAKTITDHLAVLRPQCWIMIGHCGGLRHSQRLGDYVLAHAYLRHDGVLDEDLPPEIPVPPIAEIQLALHAAAGVVTGDKGADLKSRLRTGTVVTNDDRNWELRYSVEAHRFNQSRAIAVDMESATLAANGYRFRVPYGTLLCVSDKPLHGEIKMPGAANRFYERAIAEHMLIGIEALESLRRDGPEALHSRKLRSFDEPPFR
ncbi:MAG: AMP nucleosidase [bacterium]